ncbi:MAG: hypothetical protein H6618_08000 [Deltaproteobacteria bacterium]|nr:hypothetical protein [Deltaproteobacteria bacterium]
MDTMAASGHFISLLRQLLEELRHEKPQLSVRAIAKHARVNRYFLSKILQGDLSLHLDFSQTMLLSRYLISSGLSENRVLLLRQAYSGLLGLSSDGSDSFPEKKSPVHPDRCGRHHLCYRKINQKTLNELGCLCSGFVHDVNELLDHPESQGHLPVILNLSMGPAPGVF